MDVLFTFVRRVLCLVNNSLLDVIVISLEKMEVVFKLNWVGCGYGNLLCLCKNCGKEILLSVDSIERARGGVDGSEG